MRNASEKMREIQLKKTNGVDSFLADVMAPVIVTHLGRGKKRRRQERGEIFGTFRVIRRKCVRFVTQIAIFVIVLDIRYFIIVNMGGNLLKISWRNFCAV